MSSLRDFIEQTQPESVSDALRQITEPLPGAPLTVHLPRSPWSVYRRRTAKRVAAAIGITRADLGNPAAIDAAINDYMQSAGPAQRFAILKDWPIAVSVFEEIVSSFDDDDNEETVSKPTYLPPLWEQWGLSAPPTEDDVRQAMKEARQ